MAELKNLVGERFGKLTVIDRADDYVSPQGRRLVKWKCVCDCGNVIDVTAVHLRSGDNVSCGCYGKQRRAEAAARTTHGLGRSRIYHLFQNMKQRCLNPKAANYSAYGGRGIGVCDEWKEKDGFERFYEWAMKAGYSDDLSLDRIDVN